jgi:DNA mismatch repair protein MutL
MGKIRQLDSITINKIAAGEVIDRPSSIVKELIENSIDAGATRIAIDLQVGGEQLIRISDNGKGISKEDLKIAPLRHTTSKIVSIDDIYKLGSFGFRGEALASICHVGKTDIISKTETDNAYKLTVYKDDISEPELSTHAGGTTISVYNLFQDLPVRKRFLKSPRTELSYISEVVTQFALVFPMLDFVLTHDGKECVNSTGISKQDQLVLHLFSKSLKPHLVPVDTEIGPVKIKGIISDPGITFSNRSKQIITVNSRLVKNPIIQKALQQSYRDLIPQRRFPLIILSIEVLQDGLDINVHPQKLDVKFINPGFIFDTLPKAISISLQSKQEKLGALEQSSQAKFTPLNEKFSSIESPPATLFNRSAPKDDMFSKNTTLYNTNASSPNTAQLDSAVRLFESSSQYTEKKEFDYFQLFNTYIVVKTVDGMWLLDQHAVHERILYEQFKEAQHSPESLKQMLLLSEVIELSPDLVPIFEEEQSYLESLGFSIDTFGPQQIVVRELPTLFSGANLNELLIDILTQLKDAPGSTRDLTLDQKEKLQMKACKAAIKAGKTLAQAEVKRLIEDLINSPSNFTCPHGRPLFILFDKNKLERLFLRQ